MIIQKPYDTTMREKVENGSKTKKRKKEKDRKKISKIFEK
jgi:hypothetical protein